MHFYKKEDTNAGSAETMETLVHKASGGDRNISSSVSSHVQYSSMSNTNAATTTPANPTPQVVVPQPARIAKAAKPVRDSAQFVSQTGRKNDIFLNCLLFLFFSNR